MKKGGPAASASRRARTPLDVALSPPPSMWMDSGGGSRWARPLSTFVSQWKHERGALLSQLVSPLLLWEAGQYRVELDADQQSTVSGAATYLPNQDNPLVLQVRGESSRSDSTPFGMSSVTIGRSENNDVIIPNPRVSRLHAIFHYDSRRDVWRVTDAGGRNGTQVDGKRLGADESASLPDGTRIRLGGVEIKFVLVKSFLILLASRASVPLAHPPPPRTITRR
jgi:hypothetical protein